MKEDQPPSKPKPLPENYSRCSLCNKIYKQNIINIHEAQCTLISKVGGFVDPISHSFNFASTLNYASTLDSNKFRQSIDHSYESKQRRKQNQSKKRLPEFDDFLFGPGPGLKTNINTNTFTNPQKVRTTKSLMKELLDQNKQFSRNEAAWKKFEQLVQNYPQQKVRFNDVPFLPPNFSYESIFGIKTTAPESERRSRIRQIVLRWHPDKWSNLFGARIHKADIEAILEGVKLMMTRINELKNT